jgi:putative ABC transport system permease protein
MPHFIATERISVLHNYPFRYPMIALKNLFRNKTRTAITLLGIAFGISALVSLTSVSNSFKRQIGDLVKSYHIDITVLSKGAATPMASAISMADFEALRSIKAVRAISSLIVGPVKSPWNPYFLLFGLSSMESFLSKLGLVEGRFFIPGKKEMVIGESTAKRHGVMVGDTVLIADQNSFTVVGIFKSGSKVIDGAALIEIQEAMEIMQKKDSINMAFIQTAIGANPQNIISEINRRFAHLSAVKSGEFLSQMGIIKTIDVFTWVISIIALITSSLIVMNTFFMAVTERTKEIGILRAVGWSPVMILKLIVSESVALCLLGGLLGNLLALGELWLFQITDPEGLGWLVSPSASSGIFLGSMALSILLGMVGSLFPAYRALRLFPADALRFE